MISLFVDEDLQEDAEKLRDKQLLIELKKYNEKRSLTANAYFWALCGEIAKALGSTKDVIYILMLKDYGVFNTVEVSCEALPILSNYFRLVEEDYTFYTDEGKRFSGVRCYKGSHEYDSAEMAALINGTVQQARDLGLSTYPQEVVDRLVEDWKGRNVAYEH